MTRKPNLDEELDIEQLEGELKREKHKKRYRRVLRSTIFTLVVVAAFAVLTAVLWMPVLQIYGSSMNPILNEGDIVVSMKGKQFETGDVMAFYWNNRILVKRVIAQPGDWVDMDEDGNVYVNSKKLDEPYLTKKAYGECDIKLPYQVPESKIFVMGDNRDVSIDSRSTTVGCVAEEQIVGRIIFRIWPLSQWSAVK